MATQSCLPDPQSPVPAASPAVNVSPPAAATVGSAAARPLQSAVPRIPAQPVLYPVASPGRGFGTKPASGFPPRPAVAPFSPQFRPVQPIRAPNLHHSHVESAGGAASVPINGIPVSAQPKVAPSPSSVSDCNVYKTSRGWNRNGIIYTCRGRKLRLSEDSSLYSLCRSWLKNGCHEETQSISGDDVKFLPRPLPKSIVDAELPKKMKCTEEEEDDKREEDEGSVENLSTHDLLKRHVKRARRIRSGLREERLRRIARYKTRLATLLHPQMEQK